MLAGDPISFGLPGPAEAPEDARALQQEPTAPFEDVAIDVAVEEQAASYPGGAEHHTQSPDVAFHVATEEEIAKRRTSQSSEDLGPWYSNQSTLKLSITRELLRGVFLSEVLSGFGRHWRSIKTKPNDYALSHKVLMISDFISHNWSTPWSAKMVTLLFIYNQRAACCFGCLGAVLGCISQELFPWAPRYRMTAYSGGPDVEYAEASIICGFVFYAVVLCFWQRLRMALRLPAAFVFLDKLCIDQNNEANKTEGILGLGAFLKSSERLVVLWTPHYFRRLWCTYELATWHHLDRDFGSTVKLVPVSLGWIQIGSPPVLFIGYMGSSRLTTTMTPTLYYLALLFGCLCPIAVLMRRTAADAKEMESQLGKFSFSRAACFCCSAGHKDPDTGAKLMCDRELVLQTLQDWQHRQEFSDVGMVVEKVEAKIRTQLKACFVEHAVDNMRYGDVLVALMPVLWRMLDHLPLQFRLSFSFGLSNVFLWVTIWLASFPGTFVLMHRLCRLCPAQESSTTIRQGLRIGMIALLCLVFFLFTWMPLKIFVHTRWFFGQLMWYPVVIGSTLGLHWHQLRRYDGSGCRTRCRTKERSAA
eukprot:TRINITY_DN39104_c0_g1_i2.p1 TRINITY_DN39104_c0_g1~~TRINITY_DN39104_c0_g1_i2.p1  ORF type:complete len:587 (-),score=38.88 TRINITY_DN39104_c0_g1_i2:364-2124(-)